MTIDSLIMFAGALVAVLPFLGFPVSWDNVILLVLGVFVVILGVVVRRRGLVRMTRPQQRPSAYVDSTPRMGDAHEAA